MPLVDCHVHLRNPVSIENLDSIRRSVGADRMNIVCSTGPHGPSANAGAFAAKAAYPDRFHICPGLDHCVYLSGGSVAAPSLAEQVDRALAIGADGIKLLETKPDRRKILDIPVDGDYFAPMFARAQERGVALLWHVADPEEFWDPEQCPKWAKDAGWFYDDTHVPKEQLYAEVERVLERHAGLKVVFAHFFFLSANLPRARSLLRRFPNIHLDLAPGVELLYNLSRDVPASREFFIEHADRILYGTDIMAEQPVEEARLRAAGVVQWLSGSGEHRISAGADHLLGDPTAGVIRGLSLPEDALARILHANFDRVFGPRPKPLDIGLALDESRRIAQTTAAVGGDSAGVLDAIRRLEQVS